MPLKISERPHLLSASAPIEPVGRQMTPPMIPEKPHADFVFEPLSAVRDALGSQASSHAEYHTADVEKAMQSMRCITQPGFDLSLLSHHQWGDLAAIVGGRLGAVLLKQVLRGDLHKEVQDRFRRDDSPTTRALHQSVECWAPALTAYLYDVVIGCAYLPDRRDPDSLFYERYVLQPLLRAYCGGGILGLRDAASWMSIRPCNSKKSELESIYRPFARREFDKTQNVFEREPSGKVRRTWKPQLMVVATQAQAALAPPPPRAATVASSYQPAPQPAFEAGWMHPAPQAHLPPVGVQPPEPLWQPQPAMPREGQSPGVSANVPSQWVPTPDVATSIIAQAYLSLVQQQPWEG
jgi:hypothetical protein